MSEALTRHLVTFGRVLREAGLEVGPGRMDDALRGLDHVDITRQDDVYWTLRTTLVARREDLEPFDRAFDAWFLRRAGARAGAPRGRSAHDAQGRQARCAATRATGREAAPADGEPDSIGHSAHEVLRHKDFAAMTPRGARRRARAHRRDGDATARRGARTACGAHRRGRVLDMRAPGPRRDRHRRRPGRAGAFAGAAETPRKLVVLCDVSGSMEAYSRALLLYLHAMVRSGAASRSSPSARG